VITISPEKLENYLHRCFTSRTGFHFASVCGVASKTTLENSSFSDNKGGSAFEVVNAEAEVFAA
jgi:hypothetical protein